MFRVLMLFRVLLVAVFLGGALWYHTTTQDSLTRLENQLLTIAQPQREQSFNTPATSTEGTPASITNSYPTYITNNESKTVTIPENFITSSHIARHAIESENIDTNAINSRTIENGTITGEDISKDADLTIASLEVDGAFTSDTLNILGAATVGGALSVGDAVTTRSNLGLAYASEDLITKKTSIAAWGDSLTSGAGGKSTTYPRALASLSGYTIYNGGIGGETSAQIKTRFDAAPEKHDWPTIFWVGRNNAANGTQVKADIAAMVAALGHENYLVLGILNGSSEGVGTGAYDLIVQLNEDLEEIYGEHYIDMRAYLVSQYDSGEAQDVIDHDNDVPPTSLRSDALHLNSDGYTAVAERINQSLEVLTGSSSSQAGVVTLDNLISIFNTPPTIGSVTPGVGFFSSLGIGTTTLDQGSALTIDAVGTGGTSRAIAFSGLFLGTNDLITTRESDGDAGWKLKSSGGSQTNFLITDSSDNIKFSLYTGSSTSFNSYLNVPKFALGTTTTSGNALLTLSASGFTSAASSVLTFSDTGTNVNLIGVKNTDGSDAWKITSTGGGNGFFNIQSGSTTIFQLNTTAGSYNSYWKPQASTAKFGFNTTAPDRKVDILDASNPQIRLTHTATTVYTDFQTTASGYLYINPSGGRVGIGDSTPNALLTVGNGDLFQVDSSGYITVATTPTGVGASNLCWDGSGASQWGACTSLRKYKDNIDDLSFGLDTLMKLRPVEFDWNNKISASGHDLGFIAEEVAEVNPLLAEYGGDNQALSGVKYNLLTSLIVKSVQEQQGMIETNANITLEDLSSLEERIVALEENTTNDNLTTLETQVAALLDFYTTFELGNIITANEEGDVTLTGTLKTPTVETASIKVANTDEEAPTIGQATLEAGETEVEVETKALTEESRVFITPVSDNALSFPLTITDKKQDTSFTVSIPESIERDIHFDWWIVQQLGE